MKLELGDSIERENVNWIRENIPVYEDIWSIYIGHDQNCRPLKILNLPPNMESDRERFYTSHYTLLICLLKMRASLEHIDNQQAYVPDPRAYIAIQNEITAFMASVGQARDMFKKMDGALGLKGTVWRQFQDLYQNRCSLLHGTIPAQTITDGMLNIPELAGNEKTADKWHDESRWSDAGAMKFEVAPARLKDVLMNCSPKRGAGLGECHKKIKEILCTHGARIEEIHTEFSSNNISLSGLQYFYSASLKMP